MPELKRWVPHDYQCDGLSFWLTNRLGALFLDPGLGKTSITLCSLDTMLKVGKIKGTLIIAPLRVIYSVWPREIEKWANFNHLSCTILHEGNKSSIWDKHDIYLINPEGLAWLHGELLQGLKARKPNPFNSLVVDESTKFKRHGTAMFKYLVDMLPLFTYRYLLTGTPSPRSLLDLWSQLYILDEGATLGVNYYDYRRKYFQSNDWNKHEWELKVGSKEKIEKLIAPLVLDMKAKDMPEIVINDIDVYLPDAKQKIYNKFENEMWLELQGVKITAEAAAQKAIKCHQLANGSVYEDIPLELDDEERKQFKKTRKTLHFHDLKIKALKELVGELNGKPLLVAYHFKHDLAAILEAFGDVPYIGSGVSPKRVNEIEDDWNNGKIPLLLGHPASMGHGLNLQQVSNDVCFYSITANLELYEQFYRRVYRQGMIGNCFRLHRIVCRKTVDEIWLSRLGCRDEQQTSLREAIRRYRSTPLVN